MSTRAALFAALIGGTSLSAPSLAVVNPFTEAFSSPLANWSAASAFTPLTYTAGGGPDGSGHATRAFNFTTSNAGEQPLLFRGQSNFGSSMGAFAGNWLSAAVTEFQVSVRHDGPGPVGYFARFAPFGPGAVALLLPPAPPNQWTTYTLSIAPGGGFILEGTTFAATFTNIQSVQVGVLVDDTLAGFQTPVNFDIDNVSIVPAPGPAGLLVGAMLLGVRHRRR